MRVDKTEVFHHRAGKASPYMEGHGQWPADDDTSGALVGRRLAERLNLRPGQSLELYAAAEGHAPIATKRSSPTGIRRSRHPGNRWVLRTASARATCICPALGRA